MAVSSVLLGSRSEGAGRRLDGLSHGRRLRLPPFSHVLVHRLAVEADVPGYLPVGVARQVALDDLQLLPQINHLLEITSDDSLAAGVWSGPFLKRNAARI